jgi:exopolysaccharide biosynthesis polyprenyl glycosylphosphotransferase
MDEIEGVPVMTLARPGFSAPLRVAKRAMDLGLAGLVAIVTMPIQAAVAVAILADSGGPVLHAQERIGKDGKPFTMHKFRSMTNGAGKRKHELLDRNEKDGPIFKMKSDPRVTKVGRFLRRYSLDELPQIYNVLKGDMSLVGPRPPLPSEVAKYSDWDSRRLSVTPGITGLWQVLGRSELTFDEMVSLDLNYIWNWSPWLDFSIMARTVGAVVHGKGAY